MLRYLELTNAVGSVSMSFWTTPGTSQRRDPAPSVPFVTNLRRVPYRIPTGLWIGQRRNNRDSRPGRALGYCCALSDVVRATLDDLERRQNQAGRRECIGIPGCNVSMR